MTGRLKDLTYDRDRHQVISVTVNEDFSAEFDELKDCEVKVEIKKLNRKRSLDANAYAWVLIDRIAEKTGVRKSEVYRNAIREIGGVSDTVCVVERAVDRLVTGWEHQGIGWQTEVEDAKIDGCKRVTLFYGSSVYDTAQMSRLIDLLVQDAEALGIPTITDEEAKRMLGKWGDK